jgi:aspartate ammonia-lyase
MAGEHVERDSLGEVRVPDDVYYGTQTSGRWTISPSAAAAAAAAAGSACRRPAAR